MSNILLITGGGRSGKSEYAEKQVAIDRLPKNNGVLYIATATRTDEEMEERIARHRAERPKEWLTWERHNHLSDIETEFNKNDFGTILLDCVGNLLMGILFEKIPDSESFTSGDFQLVEESAISELDSLCAFADKYDKRLVIVTNEIGLGLVPETRYSRYYRDALGRINKHLAKIADKVIFMVSGIPVELK